MFDFYHILWYFILYSFLGWCAEVVFNSVNTGKFVNRGFLNGPLCPIYGFGGVLLVVLLTPLQHSLLWLYLGSVIICSALELVAGWLLKKLFHTTWWDYSNTPFNIGGYICLKFSLMWGFAGLALMRLLHPFTEGLVDLMPRWLGWLLLAALYAMLLADLVVTVLSVNKLNRDLAEIDRLRAAIRRPSDAIAENLGNTAISVAGKVEAMDLEGKKEALETKWSEQRAKTKTSLEEQKQKLDEAAQQRREKFSSTLEREAMRLQLEQLLERQRPTQKRLMKAFPRMRNTRNSEAFTRLKARLTGQDATADDENTTPDVPGENTGPGTAGNDED